MQARALCMKAFIRMMLLNTPANGFAWANTLFGELLLKVVKERPGLV